MPDDVGGKPSPNGWEPDDERGGAAEGRWDVVFDEDFVRAAAFHEPSAVERLLAAAQARAEAETEAARARTGRRTADEDPYGDARDPHGPTYEPDDIGDDASPYGRHGGALRPYRGSARWHRPVAWVLALLMGVGMVALAFSAVYRGAVGNQRDQVPPASTGVDQPTPAPTASPADGPPVPVLTGTPATAVAHPVGALPPTGVRTAPPAAASPGTP
ncbi:SCO2584 family spore wall biosynthesis protein [Streptomyces termitum]